MFSHLSNLPLPLPLSLPLPLPLSFTLPHPPPSLVIVPAESTEVNAATEEQQEKPDEEVPSIKVEPAGGEEESPVKKRASIVPSPSRNRKSKPVSEIPEKGIQIKGYVHRKKTPFGGWERTYGVVTFAAIYFTTGEDVREFHHVCMLSGTGTVKHEKKGHDKQSEGLVIRSGKNKETLSLSAADVQSWKTALEDVLGVSGSLEFDSGDEDEAVDTTTTAAVPTTTTKAPPPIEDGETHFTVNWTEITVHYSLLAKKTVCI